MSLRFHFIRLLLVLCSSMDIVAGFELRNHRLKVSRSRVGLPQSAPSTDMVVTRSNQSKKKKKQKQQSNQKKVNRRPASTTPLSPEEIGEHVSNLYIYGPGGVLYDKIQRHTENVDDVIKKLDRHPALLLNADYQPLSHLPLSLWHWQEAIKAVFAGKVTVVDVYPDIAVKAVNWEIPLPSVIALNEYVPVHLHQQTPAFTKRNVFLRDEYRCQYCGNRFLTRDLTLDHVKPRCRGGRLHWTNAVTSCHACNGRKGSLDVSELRSVGMKLLRTPRVPTQHELAAIANQMLPRRGIHPTWEPYLGGFESADDTKSQVAVVPKTTQGVKWKTS